MTSTISEYSIVRTTADNVHLMVPLFNRVFRQRRDTRHFIRKYTTPMSKDGVFFSFMALDAEGRCVAHQAALPALFQHGAELIWGAQSCDSVAAPEVRGKGLFSKVGQAVNESLHAAGIAFIFGFTNEYSEKATEKGLGFRPIHRICGFKVRVEALPIEKLSRRLALLRSPYEFWTGRILCRFRTARRIPNTCLAPHTMAIIHDEAFFEQKSGNRLHHVELNGILLWFKVNGALHVGDMDLTDEKRLPETILSLQRICRKLGINEIVFQCSPDTPLHKLLQGKASPFASWMLMAKAFRPGLDLDRLKLTYGDVDTF